MAAKNKHETTLLCPDEEGWTLWRQTPGANDDVAVPFEPVGPVSSAADGSPATLAGARLYGFPVRAAFAVPLWIPSTEAEAVEGAMDMQLEKLSLKPEPGAGHLVEQQTLEQTDGQTLALAIVLNERQLKNWPTGGIPERFEVTPSLYYLPDNSLVLWKELGKIVAVLTRRDRPVHFQSLGAREVTPAAVHELELILMQLEMQDLAGDIEQVVLWTDAVQPEGETALRQAFGVPVVRQRKPGPALPAATAGFLPRQVAEARVAAARKKRIIQLASAAAAVYVVAASVFVFFCFQDVWKEKELRQQRNALDQVAGNVDAERTRWLQMLEVTHGARYPLERFYQVTKSLDEGSQVRLRGFEFERDKLIIKGEAENVPKAINYQNAVQRDPSLTDYEWVKNSPKNNKAGFADFELVGNLIHALPDTP